MRVRVMVMVMVRVRVGLVAVSWMAVSWRAVSWIVRIVRSGGVRSGWGVVRSWLRWGVVVKAC